MRRVKLPEPPAVPPAAPPVSISLPVRPGEIIKPIVDCVSPEAILLLQQIRHPALPCLREIRNVTVGEAEATPCFIFEYLPGISLDRLPPDQAADWPLAEKVRYMARVARVVAFLHQQGEKSLLHLDIKPANLLLGPNQQPCLIDFGSARLYQPPAAPATPTPAPGQQLSASLASGDPAAATAPKTSQGERYTCTPAYAAPELLAGQPCPGSDIYALGMTLLALVTRQEPMAGQPGRLTSQLAAVPADLARIIHRCLQSQADHRFAQADELAASLEEAAIRILHGFIMPETHLSPPATSSPSRTAWTGSVESPAHPAESPSKLDMAGNEAALARTVPRPITTQPPGTVQTDDSAEPAAAGDGHRDSTPAAATGSGPASHDRPAVESESRSAGRMIAIWDGSEFGCELAAQFSRHSRQILVVDADLLNPRADLLLGQRSRSRSLLPNTRIASLDQAFADQQRGVLTAGRLHELTQPTLVEGVDMLVSGTSLDQYEHVAIDSLFHVLRTASLAYEQIILLCSRFIYDAFTCLGLLLADQILVPLAGNTGDFREINRYVEFLSLRRQLDRQRLYFVAFAYQAETDLSWGTMDELCGGRLIGCITDTPARHRLRGSARPYAAAVNRCNQKEYAALIIRLGRLSDKETPDAADHLSRRLRRKVRRLSHQPAR